MSLRPLTLSILLALLLPSLAHAEESAVWDFRNKQVPLRTVGQGAIAVQQEEGGLHITAQSDGLLLWEKPLTQPAEVVTIRYRSNAAIDVAWIWQQKKDHLMVQLPGTLPQSRDGTGEFHLIVSRFPEWYWQSPLMGLTFPAGADIVIEEIAFRHWPLPEQILEGWKTFWTFDIFKPYSINFLWGPLLVTNSPAREALHDNLPPLAQSALRIFYLLLLFAIVGADIVYRRIRKYPDGSKRVLAAFAVVFAALWIVFDLRMGAELLSYAKTDWKSWVLAPEEERTLRTNKNVYAIVFAALPTLRAESRFHVIAMKESPYFAITRYFAYPSIPLHEEEISTKARLWAVFQRPDITVDGQGRLSMGQTPLSAPGRIVKRLGEDSFLFFENP